MNYVDSLSLLGITVIARRMAADELRRPKGRQWRKMKAPHVYPPSPFESRQVRRARERRER